jgi:hypothetical protein
MQAFISGDGAASLRAWSINQVGIGNTTAVGYNQEMSESIRASGRDMSAGMAFQWTSFAGMWDEEIPGEATGELA